MKTFPAKSRWALLLVLASAALALTGCGTTNSERVSSRPWNAPQGWETGALPSSLNQGH